jgi:hypothetical protein
MLTCFPQSSQSDPELLTLEKQLSDAGNLAGLPAPYAVASPGGVPQYIRPKDYPLRVVDVVSGASYPSVSHSDPNYRTAQVLNKVSSTVQALPVDAAVQESQRKLRPTPNSSALHCPSY